jgi:hypothetical protein
MDFLRDEDAETKDGDDISPRRRGIVLSDRMKRIE